MQNKIQALSQVNTLFFRGETIVKEKNQWGLSSKQMEEFNQIRKKQSKQKKSMQKEEQITLFRSKLNPSEAFLLEPAVKYAHGKTYTHLDVLKVINALQHKQDALQNKSNFGPVRINDIYLGSGTLRKQTLEALKKLHKEGLLCKFSAFYSQRKVVFLSHRGVNLLKQISPEGKASPMILDQLKIDLDKNYETTQKNRCSDDKTLLKQRFQKKRKFYQGLLLKHVATSSSGEDYNHRDLLRMVHLFPKKFGTTGLIKSMLFIGPEAPLSGKEQETQEALNRLQKYGLVNLYKHNSISYSKGLAVGDQRVMYTLLGEVIMELCNKRDEKSSLRFFPRNRLDTQ